MRYSSLNSLETFQTIGIPAKFANICSLHERLMVSPHINHVMRKDMPTVARQQRFQARTILSNIQRNAYHEQTPLKHNKSILLLRTRSDTSTYILHINIIQRKNFKTLSSPARFLLISFPRCPFQPTKNVSQPRVTSY